MLRLTSFQRAAAAALGCLATLGLSACAKPLNSKECETLLLRYTELLATSDRPDASAIERLGFRERARETASRDPEALKCGKSVSRGQFDCAMAAGSTDEFERCLM